MVGSVLGALLKNHDFCRTTLYILNMSFNVWVEVLFIGHMGADSMISFYNIIL